VDRVDDGFPVGPLDAVVRSLELEELDAEISDDCLTVGLGTWGPADGIE
jgi:hypothetical protein